MTEGFGERLATAVEVKKSVLVVGLDPLLERLPRDVLARVSVGASGGEVLAVRAAAAFGLFLGRVIDLVADLAVAVKPNTAFFERYGASGWDVLRQVCRQAKKAGLLVIADAKRGDIGHTSEAYADAFLGDLPDTLGPHVDAVTWNPYLGTDSIAPVLERAREAGKGIFALVRTSNPSAAEIQDLDAEGRPLHLRVADLVRRWGEGSAGPSGFGVVGAVVGGTGSGVMKRIREALPGAFFLVPGYGAQGAALGDLAAAFLPGGRGAIVNASRSILFAHERTAGDWGDAVRAAALAARAELEEARGMS